MKTRYSAIPCGLALWAIASAAPAWAADHGSVVTCQLFDSLQSEPLRIKIYHGTHAVRGQFLPSFIRGAYPMKVTAQTSRLRPHEMLYRFSFRVNRAAEGHYAGGFHPIEKITYTGIIHLNPTDPQRSTYVLNSEGTLGSAPIGVTGYESAARCMTKAF